MHSDASGAIEVDAEEVVAFAAALVRIRSVNEPGVSDEHEAAELVASRMRAWGWRPEVVEVAPGRPNVVVTVEGGGGPGPVLGFEGHLDVVTEGDEAAWTVDPYGAQVIDGRLYGRGAADMKAGVAAMLYAVRALQAAGPFPGAVRLFVLSDEEEMMLGAKHVVATGAHEGVAGLVVCEPEGGEVCPSSKGALRLRVELEGAMAHGAMPNEGCNPLPVLGRVLGALEAFQAELQAAHEPHPHLGTVYLTPTVVEAGAPPQMNTSPARASLWLDVRTIPGVDHGALVERVRRDCERLALPAGVAASVEVIDDRPPVSTGLDDPVVRHLVDAHEHVHGSPPVLGGVPGTTDGTIFTVYGKVPSVVYGPGGKWIAHQVDEYVHVDEIVRYAEVYAETARRFLAAGAAGAVTPW